MFTVDEQTVDAIRLAYEGGGELAGVVELRRHFPVLARGWRFAEAGMPATTSAMTWPPSARCGAVRRRTCRWTVVSAADRRPGFSGLSHAGQVDDRQSGAAAGQGPGARASVSIRI